MMSDILDTVIIMDGNVAATFSKTKHKAGDRLPVFWAHIKDKFEINNDTARDLGEEILLDGQIRILQGAIPKIGEADSEGIDRLYIHPLNLKQISYTDNICKIAKEGEQHLLFTQQLETSHKRDLCHRRLDQSLLHGDP
jgi:hypothetical protein